MEHPADDDSLRINFDRRLRPEFYGSRITSDAGLLAYRELDDALGLPDLAGSVLSECRRGKNARHLLTGLFRQSVSGRLAGYEDVNDAERLAHDPPIRAVVDRTGLDRQAASTSQMARLAANAVRRQLHAPTNTLASFLRTLVLPEAVSHWSMATLRDRLVKIGAKIVRHGRSVTFQMAGVTVPRALFQQIRVATAMLCPLPPA